MRYVFILLLLMPGLAPAQPSPSKHFTLEKLAEGVYAAIATPGGYAICNAGIIDLGDATLVLDPFMTPEAARDLRKTAEELTGRTVTYVVNTHDHNDHIGGNQVFRDATIISTKATKALIAKLHPEEIASSKEYAPRRLEILAQRDTSGMTPYEKGEHLRWLGYFEGMVRSLDSLTTVLPTKTFSRQMTLRGKSLSAELVCHGTGHTPSDLFLYLPEQRIIFSGDLLFIENHPWLGDGDPEKWAVYLDELAAIRPRIIVPGHGPVGTPKDIKNLVLYFKTIRETAAGYVRRQASPESDPTLAPPPPFDQWYLSMFFKPNVISAYHKLAGTPAAK